MKNKVTHNIAIAAICTPEYDVADITGIVVDALMPTGVYPRDIEVTQNVQMGFKDAVVVSAVMGVFGLGIAYGTLAIAEAAGNTIMSIARRRKARTATDIYHEEKS
jgi:hypothetical protein